MKLAFVMLAHKSPLLLKRLGNLLTVTENRIFLHIDRDVSRSAHYEMHQALSDLPRIRWLNRYYSTWGSFALVKATLAGLAAAEAEGCDYAILLSGQDYPVKPVDQLRQFLSDHEGISFLQYYSLPDIAWPSDGMTRFTRWHFRVELSSGWPRNRINNLLYKLFNGLRPRRQLPQGLRLFGGSQWWCLHRSCVAHLLKFARQQPRVVDYFRYVRIPDESFFHTVLLNSPLQDSIVNRSLTYVDWNGPPFPRVLTAADLDVLQGAEQFFARKFDPAVDERVLDLIDAQLLRCPTRP